MFNRRLTRKEKELAWNVLRNCIVNGCVKKTESVRLLCKDTGLYMIEIITEGYPLFHSFRSMYKMLPEFLTKAYNQEYIPSEKHIQTDEEIEELVNQAIDNYYNNLNNTRIN